MTGTEAAACARASPTAPCTAASADSREPPCSLRTDAARSAAADPQRSRWRRKSRCFMGIGIPAAMQARASSG
eukprot:13928500-Alexandrium_andersonii.AAC.1